MCWDTQTLIHADNTLLQLFILNKIQHSQSNTFPVQILTQVIIAFNGMSDGMTEVQNLTQSLFPFILLDNTLFHIQSFFNNRIQIFFNISMLKQCKQGGIIDQSGFQCFHQAVDIVPSGKRMQCFRIDKDHFWLIEGTDDIFNLIQIDSNLSADTGVYL